MTTDHGFVQEDLEKAKVNHQAVVQSMRAQISDMESSRNQAIEANKQLKVVALPHLQDTAYPTTH